MQLLALGAQLSGLIVGDVTNCGGGSRDARGSCTLLYGNVSTWGPKAEGHPLQRGRAVNLIAEHHLEHEKLLKLKLRVGQLGWRVMGTAARPSGKSAKGTSGGVLAMVRHHLAVAPFEGKDIVQAGLNGHGYGHD